MLQNQRLKQELHEAKLVLHKEQGTPAVRALLLMLEHERGQALTSWRSAVGPDLVACQAKYNAAQTAIDFITKPPVEFGDR